MQTAPVAVLRHVLVGRGGGDGTLGRRRYRLLELSRRVGDVSRGEDPVDARVAELVDDDMGYLRTRRPFAVISSAYALRSAGLRRRSTNVASSSLSTTATIVVRSHP